MKERYNSRWIVYAIFLSLAGVITVSLLISSVGANPTEPYVRGSFNSWGMTDPMSYVYSWSGRQVWERVRGLSGPGTIEFKIFVADWGNQWWGEESTTYGYPRSVILQTPGSNIGGDVPVTGDYVFQFWFGGSPWSAGAVYKRLVYNVPGTFNSWDLWDNMTLLGSDPWNDNWESGIYTVTGPRVENFKIVMGNTWYVYHWGWESEGTPQPMPHYGVAYRGAFDEEPKNIKVEFPANRTENIKIRVQFISSGDDAGKVRYWVMDLTPPDAPSLVSPENNALFYVTPVTLSWSSVDDHSRPVKYKVYLTRDPTFSNVEYTSDWITSTSWQTPTLQTGKWYWKVGAQDAYGNYGENSTVRSFDVAPWWNENWPYRRKITISGNHEENFQIKVIIPSDIPKGMYPSIRFLESADGGVLPYWIENDGSTKTNVAWVRRLENSDSEIWMYYGNPWVTSAENAENVFLFFTDIGPRNYNWNEGDTNVSRDITWCEYQIRIRGGKIENKPGMWFAQMPTTIEFKMWNQESYRGGLVLTGPNFTKEIACIFDGPRFWVDGTEKTGIPSRWYIAKVDLYDTNKLRTTFYWGSDNGSYREVVWVSPEKTGDWYYSGGGDTTYVDKLNLQVWDQQKIYWFDWLFIRKYAATEPTTSVGPEETWLTNWFLPQYAYRRKIEISGPFPDNFQIRIPIPSDIPQSMYPSIRFLENETSGPLPFWIEKNEANYMSAVPTAWVKKFSSADNAIYMYYGCTGALSAESGEDTFIFFTDFGGGDGGWDNGDWTKWGFSTAGVDVYATTIRLEDYGDARRDVDHGPEQGISTTERNTQRIIEFRIKNASTWRGGVRITGTWGDSETAMIFWDGSKVRFFADGTYGADVSREANVYYIGQIIMYGTDKLNVNFYRGRDDSMYRELIENVRDWTKGNWSTGADKYKLSVWDGGGTSSYYYDWFFVRKYNHLGALDPTVNFVTFESRMPTKPILQSPANGSVTSDNTPTFTWQDCENEDNYRLLVDDDQNFGSPAIDVILPANTTSYTPTTELPDDVYYWKVIAVNVAGENESDIWSFEIDTIPPTIDGDIWWAGVFFDSYDSYYFSPVGEPITTYPENVTGNMLPLGSSVTIRIRTFHNDVENVKVRIWTGEEVIVNMEKENSDDTYDYWKATISGPDSESKWWFRFVLQDMDDIDYYQDDWPRVGGWGAMSDEPTGNDYLIWFRTKPTASIDGDIWWDGVFFDSRNSFYKYPVGTPRDNFGENNAGTDQIRLRIRTWENDIENAQVRVWKSKASQEVIFNMTKAITENGFDWWEVTLPAPMEEDNWWYRFILKDGSKIDYYEDHEERDAGIGRMYEDSPDRSWLIAYQPIPNVAPEILAVFTPTDVSPDVAFDVKVTVRDLNKLNNVNEVWLVLYSSSVSKDASDNVRDHYTFKWVRGTGFTEVGPGPGNAHLIVAGCSAGNDDLTEDNWTFRVKLGKVAEPVSWNVWAKAVDAGNLEGENTFTDKFTVSVYIELSLDDNSLTFSGQQGQTVGASENPTVATVTSNKDFYIDVKGAGDWSGPGTLQLSNTKADKNGEEPYDLSISTSWQSLWSNVGWGEGVQRNIYWFLVIPSDTTPGNYSNTFYVRVSV